MMYSPWQLKAMEWLNRPNSGHTCAIVGAMLTGRKSSFGHQTSAREGGRTLRSLERRGLVRYLDVDQGLHRIWELTPKGVSELAAATKG